MFTIYNSQDMEVTQMSSERWMDKEDVVHIYNGILFSRKKEWIWVHSSEADEPRVCHTEWSKSEREKQISHFNTYLWNLERLFWWTYLQGGNGDKDRENRWQGGEESSEFQRQKDDLKGSQETL